MPPECFTFRKSWRNSYPLIWQLLPPHSLQQYLMKSIWHGNSCRHTLCSNTSWRASDMATLAATLFAAITHEEHLTWQLLQPHSLQQYLMKSIWQGNSCRHTLCCNVVRRNIRKCPWTPTLGSILILPTVFFTSAPRSRLARSKHGRNDVDNKIML